MVHSRVQQDKRKCIPERKEELMEQEIITVDEQNNKEHTGQTESDRWESLIETPTPALEAEGEGEENPELDVAPNRFAEREGGGLQTPVLSSNTDVMDLGTSPASQPTAPSPPADRPVSPHARSGNTGI